MNELFFSLVALGLAGFWLYRSIGNVMYARRVRRERRPTSGPRFVVRTVRPGFALIVRIEERKLS